MRYTEIPTKLLLDVHDLVFECNSNLKLDDWNDTVEVTLHSEVLRYLEPLTKWLDYAVAELWRTEDLDPDTKRRLFQTRNKAEKAEQPQPVT